MNPIERIKTVISQKKDSSISSSVIYLLSGSYDGYDGKYEDFQRRFLEIL